MAKIMEMIVLLYATLVRLYLDYYCIQFWLPQYKMDDEELENAEKSDKDAKRLEN